MSANRRVNLMDHPAYNTASISLQDKLRMPEVRWAIVKAIVASITVAMVSVFFAVISIWIMLAVPIWYREYDELYADLWKEKVGCVADAKMSVTRVILECDAMHFNIAPSLETTFERTLAEFVLENPHSKYVLIDLVRCHNTGWCKSALLNAIDMFIQSRMWVLIVSWIPTLWGVLVLIQRCMMPYWNKVWHQLTRETKAEVRWGSMKKEDQEQVLRDIIAPPMYPSPPLPPDTWTTANLSAAFETTSEEDDDSSSLGESEYCIDEAKRSRPTPRRTYQKPPPRLTESNDVGRTSHDN